MDRKVGILFYTKALCIGYMWPHSQDATMSNVAGKTRNLPLVRWKLALHVHPVVIYDSWRGVDHLWWLLKENILFVLISSLWYCMWLVRYSSSQVHISDTMTGAQNSRCSLLVICDEPCPPTARHLTNIFADVLSDTIFRRSIIVIVSRTLRVSRQICTHDT